MEHVSSGPKEGLKKEAGAGLEGLKKEVRDKLLGLRESRTDGWTGLLNLVLEGVSQIDF